MLVKELIAELQKQNQDARVVSVAGSDDGYYGLWNTSTELYVGPCRYPFDQEDFGDFVVVCGAETLIAESAFGESLQDHDKKRIFEGWSVALGRKEGYKGAKYTWLQQEIYRHYPMIEGAKGGDNYIDCCFEEFHNIFAGEN
jgi:hypothetical protein